ncbi:E3 ubiquitin-protein ligase TRIM33-like [Patiria miniata]|uniref:Uncharacterized protein n=1 Tax=Patiria miniata TaxID=46514 RepID=A0A913Z1Q2_PATMI|nr:E3 ubiquitin-protein ligase TRIM33-like [Patiria miniata]
MAEGSISEPESGITAKKTQECSICFTEYKDPRMLECSHTFCLQCLQELKQAQNKEDKNISCPLCRKETILTEGVEQLPSCQEGVTKEEDQDGGQVSKVICQACDEENEAICRCMDCEQYLCKECQRAHQRWVAFRKHKISELEPDGKLKDYVPRCKEHPEQELCFYCNTCDALICSECTISKHKKSSHFFDSIETAFSKCSQEINEAVSQTARCIQESDRVDIDHSRHRLATMLRRTKIRISLAAEEEIANIKQEEQGLRQQAQDIFAQRDKQFAFAATGNQTVNKVKSMLSDASCYEVLGSKTKLLQDLREHTEIRSGRGISHQQSFVCFEKGHSRYGKQIGSLKEREYWRTGGISCEYNDEMPKPHGWTCMTAYSTGKLVLSGDDEFISCNTDLHEKGTGYNPTALTVNSEDQLVLLDGLSVKVLNQEFQMLHQFVPSKMANIDGRPTCLAVDEHDVIAVGYNEREQISLHNPDGTLIKTLPAPKIENRLVVSNKRLIYTVENKSDNCKITAADFAGDSLFTIDTNLSHGVPCCDEAGDIYFATEGSLLHCSADGVIVQSWERSNIPRPKDIIYLPDEGKIHVLGEEDVRMCYVGY